MLSYLEGQGDQVSRLILEKRTRERDLLMNNGKCIDGVSTRVLEANNTIQCHMSFGQNLVGS